MDSSDAKANADAFDGIKPSGVENYVGLGAEKGEAEDDGDETSSLLPQVANGGTGNEGDKKSTRKVQWNDRNGNKLVEVLEFQPSDSSDSEDEDGDSCICSIM